MKFQNCILINFVTDTRTHALMDKPQTICPFSKVGGITIVRPVDNSEQDSSKT